MVVASMVTLHRWMKTWQEQVGLCIVLTEFSRQKFIEGGLPAEKIVVKLNCVHPDPGMREGNGSYVLFVGRLSAEKGVRTLLKAWRLLRDIPLVIVGDGPLFDEMQAFLDGKDLDISMLGRKSHDEVLGLMKRHDFWFSLRSGMRDFP